MGPVGADGAVAELSPGDIIEIERPQEATVLARDVRLLRGRLGVHCGRNAVETIGWIGGDQNDFAGAGN